MSKPYRDEKMALLAQIEELSEENSLLRQQLAAYDYTPSTLTTLPKEAELLQKISYWQKTSYEYELAMRVLRVLNHAFNFVVALSAIISVSVLLSLFLPVSFDVLVALLSLVAITAWTMVYMYSNTLEKG